MHDDWSDAWLQQAAGWKAVKEGRSLYDRGLISNARFDGDLCSGVVAGAKPRRVNVKRLSATIAEATCGCPDNQRSGAMCAHAVAVILAARDAQGQAAVPPMPDHSRVPQMSMPSPAYRILFYPSWEKEWALHRGTVRVEQSERLADDADEALQAWAVRSGLGGRALPWMLSLRDQEFEDFLGAIKGHSEITLNKQTIVCNQGLPRIFVRSECSEDGLRISLEDESGCFLGGKRGAWWRRGEQMFEILGDFERVFLFHLFSDKISFITHNQCFENEYLRAILVPGATGDPLHDWHAEDVAPKWSFEIEGSLRQLRMKVAKLYQVHERTWTEPLEGKRGFLCQISNKCFFARDDDHRVMLGQIRAAGWTWSEERQYWQLEGEDATLTFLTDEREQWESMAAHFALSPQLATILERMVMVTPQLEIQARSPSEATMQLSFATPQGKPLDPMKIRKLLQTGKRLIQTNDGNSLILPQESWEVFQRSIGDLHLAQNQGEYLARNHEVLAIEYLRKYFSKTLKINDYNQLSLVEFPRLNATMRDYQSWGASWLHERLSAHGFALLADEMGLGKTLQTIALLTLWATPEQPALVVVPTSLLHNWQREIERFAPHLQTIVLHGAGRDDLHAQFGHHVVVTSYGILMNDRALFLKREYSLMVLDEASAIRNPDTEMARCCFRMKARYKLALTGTPLENSLRDLWSIFQFLQPGYLGDRQAFRDQYERAQTPQSAAMQSLRIRVLPFLLRRTKEQVAKDLPSKIESDEWCELSPEQAQLYQSVWEAGMEKIEGLMAANEQSVQMSVLTLLLRLRQICCDAALFDRALVQTWSLSQRSRKMERLFEIAEGVHASGRKMLVFSQFATLLHLIEQECRNHNMASLRLDGASRNRQEIIEAFQETDGPSIFLISLKAGGYGLNLTQASTVVHFDPWWNPAAEHQATDRAHRIGQQQTVNVYRLLTRGSVEERVKNLQALKSHMAEQMLGREAASGALAGALNLKEMKDLLHKARL